MDDELVARLTTMAGDPAARHDERRARKRIVSGTRD